ncbi:DUF3015 family protein [Halobacteriovorax sp. GB3]|uniref:DUF3015 family protein n=1 Tax=Halobacteriovorax sp. GB3 TaxID=2719615 RepID=UPI002361D230|nr:DUF3015 family protein [Halobacteriovorax sp. GB3]MDD0854299.1 DUF3015 family protein [Halobacteriovorax sp. GB3]
MKKMLALTAGIMMSGSVMAAHGPAGCGLGSILFKGKDGLVFNVLAATFNGTSGNQTFGMSTGTLGCEDAKTATVAAVSFIDNNKVALSNDIARGEGQTLDAYLTLIKADTANKMALKKNFSKIFVKGHTSQEIHSAISNVIKL